MEKRKTFPNIQSSAVMILAALAAIAGLTGSLTAQPTRALPVGVLNIEQIIAKSKKFAGVRDELEARREAFEGELQTQSKELETLLQDMRSQREMLSDEQKDEITRDFMIKEKEIVAAGKEKSQQLDDLRRELLKPLLADLNQVVEDVAQQIGLEMVFKKRDAVAYHKESYDITQSVIDRLDQGA